MSKFINLRCFSDYSLQLGVSKVQDFHNTASSLGHDGFSITDKMSLAGVVSALNAKKSSNFSLVMGIELNLTKSKNMQHKDNPYNKVTVFIKNYEGYKNVCKMLATASTPKYFYYKPRVDFELLAAHKEGLILSCGDIDSPVGYEFETESGEDEAVFLQLKEMFGEDFYAEISLYDNSKKWNKEIRSFVTESNTQASYNKRIKELSEKHDVKCFVSSPAYMTSKDMHFVQQCMILNSPGNNGWHLPEALYLRSAEEIEALRAAQAPFISRAELHNMMAMTVGIKEKCKNFDIEFELHLPNVEYDKSHLRTSVEANKRLADFKEFCKVNDKPFSDLFEVCEGEKDFELLMLSIFNNNKMDLFTNRAARERTLSELVVTQRNGIHKFSDYFNPLEDATNFVREKCEFRGFSRGSGGGSIINYLMDVTDLDPLEFQLIYERFNSRARVGEYFFEVDES